MTTWYPRERMSKWGILNFSWIDTVASYAHSTNNGPPKGVHSLIPGTWKPFTWQKGHRVVHTIKCDDQAGETNGNGGTCLQRNHQITRVLRSWTGDWRVRAGCGRWICSDSPWIQREGALTRNAGAGDLQEVDKVWPGLSLKSSRNATARRHLAFSLMRLTDLQEKGKGISSRCMQPRGFVLTFTAGVHHLLCLINNAVVLFVSKSSAHRACNTLCCPYVCLSASRAAFWPLKLEYLLSSIHYEITGSRAGERGIK